MDFSKHWVKYTIAGVLAWLAISYAITNSNLNSSEAGWAIVGSEYQTQSEKIPNLVEVTKGFAAHESGVQTKVAELNAAASAIKIDASNLAGNPEAQKKLSDLMAVTSPAITQIRLNAQQFPDLKANQQFNKLMDELAGTNNRISVARRDAIQKDRNYNSSRGNPLLAGFVWSFVFKPRTVYVAPEGSNKPPVVKM